MSTPVKDGRVVVIGGPTASGKSGLALALAEALDGVIVNADSMQLYRDLRVLTARPGPADEARAPHRLYGALAADDPSSAARWRRMALDEIAAARAARKLPIVVGGTGLYLRALTDGIAAVPEIPEAARAETRARFAALGGPAFHAELAARDPVMAARLKPGDAQRLIRAAEVLAATGRSLAEWQAQPGEAPPPDLRFHSIVLTPPREPLYAACDARFLKMTEAGAIEETERLLALDPPADAPVMKAIGVREIGAWLAGAIGRVEAVERAQRETRRYAKRQLTWFRHQTRPTPDIAPFATRHTCHAFSTQYSDKMGNEIVSLMREAG